MEQVHVEWMDTKRIVRITLDHAAKRNALSMQVLQSLCDYLGQVRRNVHFNAVIIRAQGPVFSAGHDLAEILGHDTTSVRAIFQQCAETMALIHDLPQIVIAEVSGLATAAGCQLVAACDLAVAAQSARFATPGVKIGFFCASPSVQVARSVPRKQAAEMLFTGRWMTAADARAYGLINRVVPDEEISSATLSLASEVAAWSLPVLASGKEFLHQQWEMTESGAAHYAIEYMARQSQTRDAVEGMTAFFEKRPPRWSDRSCE
ncbi:MAG: enoyl-CoA hydratase [Sulfobacillus acidophilus]|uniref:Enoyl-CoA hydratase domain-containing protein 3, mitochondrial n=1 Tax=Sulfobacillus acidophilus TaxID=53633 RepID=A0A2T2WLP1_9FIRM|nr:MAG: enoyl-CoA hydratase [Sulfobacillus acidophilus]